MLQLPAVALLRLLPCSAQTLPQHLLRQVKSFARVALRRRSTRAATIQALLLSQFPSRRPSLSPVLLRFRFTWMMSQLPKNSLMVSHLRVSQVRPPRRPITILSAMTRSLFLVPTAVLLMVLSLSSFRSPVGRVQIEELRLSLIPPFLLV